MTSKTQAGAQMWSDQNQPTALTLDPANKVERGRLMLLAQRGDAAAKWALEHGRKFDTEETARPVVHDVDNHGPAVTDVG